MNDIDKGILCSAIAAACAFLSGCTTPALRAATTPDDFIAVTNSSLSRDEVNARELPCWADPERGLFYFQNPKTQQSKDDALRPAETLVPASHPSYREWLQQRRHTSRFREDGDPDDELNGLAMPVRTVEVKEIVDKGITPPLGQDTREKALIDDTKSTLGQTLINDAK